MITNLLGFINTKLGIPIIEDIISTGKVSRKVGDTLSEASSTMQLVRMFIYGLAGVVAFLVLLYLARLIISSFSKKK